MGEPNSIPQTSLMKKLRLNSVERLVITHLFPDKGNKFRMMIADELSKKIEHTEAEKVAIGMRMKQNPLTGVTSFYWENGKDASITLSLNEVEATFLRERAELADREERITRELLPVCKKIAALGTPEAEADSIIPKDVIDEVGRQEAEDAPADDSATEPDPRD
jgi:hypothetical protein